VWLAGSELDLVARRGRTLVFCEVKSKADDRFGRAVEMVDAEKVRRVRRAAEIWLSRHPELDALRVRFDVVAVDAGRLRRLADAF
jgi:putative endonuclease